MPRSDIRYAIVTGASSGIGYELAICCARAGFDLMVAADEREIHAAGRQFAAYGVDVDALQVDLATAEGIARLHAATRGRPVDALLANAGRGLGGAFLDMEFGALQHVVDTNVTGTLELVHRVGRDMRARGRGRILLTGSIAGFMPGAFNAVYNASKAFVDSFAAALRNELKDSGVSVTCLMPGVTDTEFFARAGMQDTRIAQSDKDDPADVARSGFDAMMRGDSGVITGLRNKLEAAVAMVMPSEVMAEAHRRQSEPGSANR